MKLSSSSVDFARVTLAADVLAFLSEVAKTGLTTSGLAAGLATGMTTGLTTSGLAADLAAGLAAQRVLKLVSSGQI